MLQRTPEWHQARLGKATASRMGDLTARLKSGAFGSSRTNYLAELVIERLTGRPTNGYVSKDMQFGIDNEPAARDAYAIVKGVVVEEVGFLDHPTIPMAGASPDGLINNDGLVEIKVPNKATHLATKKGAPIDSDYLKQIQFQLAVTDRVWCDYVSYHPEFPEWMQLEIRRIHRDDAVIKPLEVEVMTFLADVSAEVAYWEKRRP